MSLPQNVQAHEALDMVSPEPATREREGANGSPDRPPVSLMALVWTVCAVLGIACSYLAACLMDSAAGWVQESIQSERADGVRQNMEGSR